jgi:SulP family sulfate permease
VSRQTTPSWTGDLFGGLAAMLVALPSSIAFGVLVYTALGQEHAAEGAMAGILGAAAIGLVSPLIGRTGGLISAPCAPAAAVMSTLAAGLLAGTAGLGNIGPEKIVALMALAALLSAVFQVLYGAVGGGKLIKFIPYPVVSGYLSGVSVLIAIGQLPKLFGVAKGTSLAAGLFSPGLWNRQGLAVGLVTMAVMAAAPRITRKVPAAVVGLLSGMLAYFGLSLFFPRLLEIQSNPLVIGRIQASGSFFEAAVSRATSLFDIHLADFRLILVPALTLSILLSIDTLKTCVVLDALTRSRHNSNRELLGQGAGNFVSFLAGGMPGAGTMGPTLVNVTSGGRTYRSGILEGLFVVLALLLLSPFIAWVPIGALAGILLVVAWRMFDWNMFRLLRHPSTMLNFAVIAGVILVAVTVDLIAASVVGVALAILLFIRDQVRGSVIRHKRSLKEVSSKTHRLAAERALLDQHGDQGILCELQGNLFFGTTDQLFSQLDGDLQTRRFILLDMRRVQSVDYTAAHLFEQMETRLEEHGGQLLFSGLPSALPSRQDMEKYLAQLGLVREGGGIRIFDTLDGALEWMEEQILQAEGLLGKHQERPLEAKEIDLFREFDEETLGRLTASMRAMSVREGEKVFSRGDKGDELFLIRRGGVRILLPLEGGKRHHLATFARGDFFGEISFLDRSMRSADAEAKAPTDLYVLSRARFDECSRADAAFGVRVFARLALAMALRLRQTDAELRALQER